MRPRSEGQGSITHMEEALPMLGRELRNGFPDRGCTSFQRLRGLGSGEKGKHEVDIPWNMFPCHHHPI